MSPATAINQSKAPIANVMLCAETCRKVIRHTKNGLDECIPCNAYNEPQEVHHPNDSCSRFVNNYFLLAAIENPCGVQLGHSLIS